MDLLDEHELRDDAAERGLLGAVALAPDALAGVLAALPAGDFYNPHRAAVWRALRARSADRRSLNPAAVARDLAQAGRLNAATQAVITTEMSNAQPAHYAPEWAKTVADLARRREYARAIKRAAATLRDHPGDHSETLAAVRSVFDELDADEARLGGTRTWIDLLDEFEAEHDPTAERSCILTPWPDLDELIGGLFPGRVYVIGGLTGDGKSTTAINIAAHAAQLGHAPLIFSKEMPTVDVTGRLIANGAEINLAKINSRHLDDFDRVKVRDFGKRTSGWRLRVNADPIGITGVKHISRALHHRGQLDLLVVDYLQLMNSDERGRSREEEIAKISTALKNIAMELMVPVVVPAQLNRGPTARPGGRPTKSDYRESGRIEQDADVGILLWRKPVEDGPDGEVRPDPHHLTIIVDKNRHGPTGEVELRWNGGYGRVG
jgi:replicative DNA helicase